MKKPIQNCNVLGSRRNSTVEDIPTPLTTKSGTILRNISSTGKQLTELLKNPTRKYQRGGNTPNRLLFLSRSLHIAYCWNFLLCLLSVYLGCYTYFPTLLVLDAF